MSRPSYEVILDQLELGQIRAAMPDGSGNWKANIEVKQAVLEAFRSGKNIRWDELTEGQYRGFVDKDSLPPRHFTLDSRIRLVPGGSSVRRGAYIASGVVIMPPAFVNVAAYIDEGSMVDSHVLVGSCAQVGKRVHLSAGVQLGGVLEPIGEVPVVIEDDVFVGAGSVIVEGIRVCKRAVIAPGVVLSKSVSLYDAVNEVVLEKGAPVPEGAVVVAGTRPLKTKWGRELNLQVATPVIIKYRDEKSEASLLFEELLRA